MSIGAPKPEAADPARGSTHPPKVLEFEPEADAEGRLPRGYPPEPKLKPQYNGWIASRLRYIEGVPAPHRDNGEHRRREDRAFPFAVADELQGTVVSIDPDGAWFTGELFRADDETRDYVAKIPLLTLSEAEREHLRVGQPFVLEAGHLTDSVSGRQEPHLRIVLLPTPKMTAEMWEDARRRAAELLAAEDDEEE